MIGEERSDEENSGITKNEDAQKKVEKEERRLKSSELIYSDLYKVQDGEEDRISHTGTES